MSENQPAILPAADRQAACEAAIVAMLGQYKCVLLPARIEMATPSKLGESVYWEVHVKAIPDSVLEQQAAKASGVGGEEPLNE